MTLYCILRVFICLQILELLELLSLYIHIYKTNTMYPGVDNYH